jgi:hypothetical protein
MSSSLNSAIGNGKRFMAYDIVNRLKEKNEWSILNCLQEAVRPYGRKRGKLHEIWTDAFDVKECRTENFILQKLSYIHNNPCAGKWKLVDSPIDYLHSSAAFYISGKKCGYAVRDYREFL